MLGQPRHVGILGATSLVGACLLPLLTGAGWQVTAFSRRRVAHKGLEVLWQQLPASGGLPPLASLSEGSLPLWICVAPIWVLPEYFGLLDAQRARRVVVLSSTSRFTKDDSTDPEEQATARRLADAEDRVQAWAESRGVEWVILRPTLIYGLGRDKNIAEMARIICRLSFFPLFGRANGLRQPIHAEDVALVCLSALQMPNAANQTYNISGSETIPYREMVTRVFTALERPPRLLTVPLWAFRLAVAVLRYLPGHRQWSAAMAERMNRDLVFDHAKAARELSFKPRAFELTAKDLPL